MIQIVAAALGAHLAATLPAPAAMPTRPVAAEAGDPTVGVPAVEMRANGLMLNGLAPADGNQG
jgi:hypothetical protein